MLESLLSLILIYTYPLLFLVGFLASLGLPLPATALFLAGGAFVGSGYLDGYLLFFAGWSACVLGDISGFTLAHRYGETTRGRYFLSKWLSIESLEKKYKNQMQTQGFFLIFLSRFLFTAIGPAVNILA